MTMQGGWEQCIFTFGCFFSGMPYTKYGVYYNGTYNIQQKAM